ncbi:helix-turn-helix transcriptional regulator (plasmid) [Streptomyces sp. FXJ1.172]|uniref:helix-turn-helix domain-containing protein n=1 Tax=Streptomyces sp. FXJ1.172 TaxID=710705 RepID=UPI0023DD5D95|nr:helix-turn-helix transcriptional regulator [Streptomyces sp. FXJ1.172]WEP01023.1 helix-turn-helix transcriptional regulator [Streptomyces sp. FXJ1.172]
MGIFARDESRTELAASQVARQATASLAGLLAGLGKTRSDLAKAMGVSPGRVSQIMSGDANLTVRTLAAVAEALDADVQITFCPRPQSAGAQGCRDSDSTAVRSMGSPAHH